MTTSLAQIDRRRSALLVVDLQPDFMPGGALAVAGGDLLVGPIRELMGLDLFGLTIATQDWHPPGHASFASAHPGYRPFDTLKLYGRPQILWPDHCVQGSAGARLHPGLPWERAAAIVRKGMERDVDSYSALRNNWDRHGERPATGLGGYLHERGIGALYLCGLARDFCVKWSAEDGAAAGFATAVLWDLTRPVDPAADALVAEALGRSGVQLLDSGGLRSLGGAAR
jgi:nicotinamidase/pyrazinamidase